MSSSLQPHGLYSPSRSSVYGISQARILEWVVISFKRISLTQGLNPHLLHWQADSLPLSCLGSLFNWLINQLNCLKSNPNIKYTYLVVFQLFNLYIYTFEIFPLLCIVEELVSNPDATYFCRFVIPPPGFPHPIPQFQT